MIATAGLVKLGGTMLANKLRPKPLQNAAYSAGQQAISGGLGMMLGRAQAKWNDKRQLEQQEKLQELQIAGAKELSDYSYGKQMEMWKNTNYAAQGEQLEKAGLNKGLMYGMSSGGGTTTGSGGGGMPTGGSAPSGGGEQLALMQAGLGLQMQKAQVENINANTAKTKADTVKTQTVDTEETKGKIALLAQQTTSEEAKAALLRLEGRAQQLENQFNAATIEHRKALIYNAYDQAELTKHILQNQKDISDETKNTVIQQAKESLNETVSRIALNNQNVQAIIAQTGLTQQQTNMLLKNISWVDIAQEDEHAQKKALADYYHNEIRNKDMTVSEQQWIDMGKGILQALGLGQMLKTGGPTPVQGFRR